MDQNLGRRLAALRAEIGLTQQEVADRLGVSRVAVSHIEANMSTPSERTIVLMAGLFKLEPHELVDGTGYPMAKAERLPPVAARYTEVELQLVLCEHDLAWFERLDRVGIADIADLPGVAEGWRARLAELHGRATAAERTRIESLRRRLADVAARVR